MPTPAKGSSSAGRLAARRRNRGKPPDHAEPVRSGDEQRPTCAGNRCVGKPYSIPGRNPRQRIAATMLELAAGRLNAILSLELMKPYFMFLPIPVLLLASCGNEPRAGPQPRSFGGGRLDGAFPRRTGRRFTSHRHGPRAPATISSKVMGYVQRVSVQSGDHVRQGRFDYSGRAGPGCERAAPKAGRAGSETQSPRLECQAPPKANLDLAQATFKRMGFRQKSISNRRWMKPRRGSRRPEPE